MKEWIYSSDGYKWKFFKYYNMYLLDSESSKDKEKYYRELIPGVFGFIRYPEKEKLEKVEYNSELYHDLMKKFFCPLKPMDFLELSIISLQIINKYPRLQYSTLLGWIPYEDKTKDPNYFDYPCIFPDGNTYTIVLHKGELSVFPGYTTGTTATSLYLPLVSHKINLNQWAEKIYKNDEVIIEFLN